MQTDDRGLAGGHDRSRAGGGEHLPPVSVEVSGLGAIHVEIGHDTRRESATAPKGAASAASTKNGCAAGGRLAGAFPALHSPLS